MNQRKALVIVLALVGLALGLQWLWPWLAQLDAAGGMATLGRSTVVPALTSPRLTELRLADLELKAAEYHPGRDPFRFQVKPPPPPPPPVAAQTAPAQVQPQPPPTLQPADKRPPAPQPPTVDVVYLGSFGPERGKIAVFGDGSDIYNVRKGDILKEHFVVESINYESADLKYVNFPQLPATRLAAGE